MSGGWGCPHEADGICKKREAPCEPGKEGCVLCERMAKAKEEGKKENGEKK